uniref:MYND-type domain-containing protein n=1 Tax=Panagrolaimus davidi TaxID=227884 RepID=A0A914P4H8_9BILA
MYPNSLRFMYFHAIALCMQDELPEECIKALDDFLALAPKDHDKVPACYYRKATYYLSKEDNNNFYAFFKKGLEAERDQLPCFLPYQFPMKDMLMKAYIHGGMAEGPSASRQLKNILSDPMRKLMITENRGFLMNICADPTLLVNTVSKPLNSPKPPKWTSLKPIMIKDMDPTIDKVYDGYVLDAKIIDFGMLIKSSATIIQDENGDIQRIAVYKWPSKGNRKKDIAEAIKVFRPNVKVSIISPYMRMSRDGKNIIRVEGPKYIKLDDTFADEKCTFCGKQTKVLACSACNMARYCSKECQKIDWIEFNHKGICKHLKSYSAL